MTHEVSDVFSAIYRESNRLVAEAGKRGGGGGAGGPIKYTDDTKTEATWRQKVGNADGSNSNYLLHAKEVTSPGFPGPITVVRLEVHALQGDSYDDYWNPEPRRRWDKDREVVINSVHYTIGSEAPGWPRGYGGHKWEIQFHDGRRVTTTNLWHQGTIPPKWRPYYPDNAEFVPQPPRPSLADTLRDVLG